VLFVKARNEKHILYWDKRRPSTNVSICTGASGAPVQMLTFVPVLLVGGYPKNPDKAPEHKRRECKDVQEHK
jgi:hypothetical protein